MNKKGYIAVVITAVVAVIVTGAFLMYLPKYKENVISENQDKRNKEYENTTYEEGEGEQGTYKSLYYNVKKWKTKYKKYEMHLKGVRYNVENVISDRDGELDTRTLNVDNKENIVLEFRIINTDTIDNDFDLGEFLDRLSITTSKYKMQKDDVYINYGGNTVYIRNLGENNKNFEESESIFNNINRDGTLPIEGDEGILKISVYYVLDEYKKGKAFKEDEVTVHFEEDEYKTKNYTLKMDTDSENIKKIAKKHYEKYKGKYKK